MPIARLGLFDGDREKLDSVLRSSTVSAGLAQRARIVLLASQGVSNSEIARREYGVQPWRAETFKYSADPDLVAKVHDVVALYLSPPDKAIVLSIDEKSQIQALNRTQPMLPMQPGSVEKRTHDYVRHGTTTLFAALEVATGTVTTACKPRNRGTEYLTFLKQVARGLPRPGTAPDLR
jgi:hypothetical protein